MFFTYIISITSTQTTSIICTNLMVPQFSGHIQYFEALSLIVDIGLGFNFLSTVLGTFGDVSQFPPWYGQLCSLFIGHKGARGV